MVRKLDYQTFMIEFGSNWMLHSLSLVQHLNNKLSKLSFFFAVLVIRRYIPHWSKGHSGGNPVAVNFEKCFSMKVDGVRGSISSAFFFPKLPDSTYKLSKGELFFSAVKASHTFSFRLSWQHSCTWTNRFAQPHPYYELAILIRFYVLTFGPLSTVLRFWYPISLNGLDLIFKQMEVFLNFWTLSGYQKTLFCLWFWNFHFTL